MFENPRRGRQARNFTTNTPKILDLKSSSEQIFSRKLPLGAPAESVAPIPRFIKRALSQFPKLFNLCIATRVPMWVSCDSDNHSTEYNTTDKILGGYC